jgi:hypothetical protein
VLNLEKSETRSASISKAQKLLWSNPEYKAKMSAQRKGRSCPWLRGDKSPMRRPEVIEKVKEILNRPGMREKRIATFKGRSAPAHTEEHRKKVSDAMKGRPFAEEHRKHVAEANRRPDVRAKKGMRGEKNPNWRGGTSFAPYCSKFNEELKENVRDAFGRKCAVCGKHEEVNGTRLPIHHVNFDKMSGCYGRSWNLVPLCPSCHSKTNYKRYHWFARLINQWVEKYTLVSQWACWMSTSIV